MKFKIILLFILFGIISSYFPPGVKAQCHQQTMTSGSYEVNTCHGNIFQQAVGGIVTAYGSCDGLFFTSPLTEPDRTTSLQADPHILPEVFPNPVDDILHVQSNGSGINRIIAFSPLGEKVFRKEYQDADAVDLDTKDWMPGAFILFVFSVDGNHTTYKIIKLN